MGTGRPPIHGMRKHPIYSVWAGMKTRCTNPKHDNYANYGGRGIKVCVRWQDPLNFIQDMLPTWKPGLTLDRLDNNGNYEPGNVRWATHSEQQRNKRSFGELPIGVSIGRNRNRYQAQIRINGKKQHLGMFNTIEEAANAYAKAKESL